MNINKRLQIVDILFKDVNETEITEEVMDKAIRSIGHGKIKKAEYKRKMIEKYGEDVFIQRAKKMGKAIEKKPEAWRKERAKKASEASKEQK